MDDMQKCTGKNGCGLTKPLNEFAVVKGKPKIRCKECDNKIGSKKADKRRAERNGSEGKNGSDGVLLYPLRSAWV